MGKGGKGSYKSRQKQKQMACATLILALVALVVVLAVLYFTVFKPKDPKVDVQSMQLLSLYTQGYPSTVTSVNLTLMAQVKVYNPNRAKLYVEEGGCTASLYYHGERVGFAAMESPTVAPEAEANLAATLTVEGSAPLQGAFLFADAASGMLQLGISVSVSATVTTLSVFSHRSTTISTCTVVVSLSARGVESFSCQRPTTIDV